MAAILRPLPAVVLAVLTALATAQATKVPLSRRDIVAAARRAKIAATGHRALESDPDETFFFGACSSEINALTACWIENGIVPSDDDASEGDGDDGDVDFPNPLTCASFEASDAFVAACGAYAGPSGDACIEFWYS